MARLPGTVTMSALDRMFLLADSSPEDRMPLQEEEEEQQQQPRKACPSQSWICCSNDCCQMLNASLNCVLELCKLLDPG